MVQVNKVNEKLEVILTKFKHGFKQVAFHCILFYCFPLIDFESFDVPEEHRLSHMSLTGVPLMTFDSGHDRFASSIPLPAKQPLISWDYGK